MSLGSSPASGWGALLVVVLLGVVVEVVEGAVVPPWREAGGMRATKKAREDKEWCDDVLGCLYLTDDWNHPSRPLNFLPFTRDYINTNFMIHTRTNSAIHENIPISADRESVEATTFDPTKPTKVILHGFIDTGNLKWLRQLAEALLTEGDYNVIRVDWGGGSLPLYGQACANIRVVGLEIAYLINFLTAEFGLDPAMVHLMGHSLGSHASGYAGEKIPGLGRITGMDPAGPYFAGTPDFIHLDASDATFVDIIHTDSGMIITLAYGTDQEMGNLDFYPNNGHDQPGCNPVDIGLDMIIDINDGIRELAACSHGRSYEFFTDATAKSCPYLAHECASYDSFEIGRCGSCKADNSACAYLGPRAEEYTHKDRVGVRMYLDTDKDAPFCYYHYQVIIDTAHPKNAEDWVQGHLDLWMQGDNGEIIEHIRLTKEHEKFDHGQLKYFMFKSHTDLSRVIRVDAEWHYDDTLTNPGSYCWLLLCNRALYVQAMQISSIDYYPEENRLDHTRTLCQYGSSYVEIKSGHTENLYWDESCQIALGRRD